MLFLPCHSANSERTLNASENRTANWHTPESSLRTCCLVRLRIRVLGGVKASYAVIGHVLDVCVQDMAGGLEDWFRAQNSLRFNLNVVAACTKAFDYDT